jgi:hypothetical protein
MTATVSTWARTIGPVGWAKIVRIAAATMSVLPLVTLASTLRMKWTRHRCHEAPTIVASMAFIKPAVHLVVVGDHQLHLAQVTVAQAAQELGPGHLGLAVTEDPRTSRRPSELTPVAITTAWDTTRPPIRALQ